MTDVVINGRFRKQRMTGIQRVAQAITGRLTIAATVIEPELGCAAGVAGHAWEQIALPLRARGRLIWGPSNTGPVGSRNQILSIHGAAVLDHPEWFAPAFVRMSRTLWPLLARRVRAVVTVSQFSRRRILELLPITAERVHVIYNGVDDQFRPASADAIAAATAAVGIGDRPYFATLSTLEPRKNLKLVLRAWSRALAWLPHDMTLLVIGGQGSRSVFGRSSRYAPALGERVRFSGYVDDALLPPLLSGATAVLYPSLYEGFGLPVLEAMACGAPVVTTRQTSLPEVGGDAALYTDPGDAEPLAALLVRLAASEELRRERAALGLARAKLFTWQDAGARMDALLAQHT